MAEGANNVLPRAVGFVLDNWTVLQLAIQHGFGGIDSRDKLKWLKDVIVQVLNDNRKYFGVINSPTCDSFSYVSLPLKINLCVSDKVEYDELEDYISEILYNEFNTIVEDGSLVKVCIIWLHKNTRQDSCLAFMMDLLYFPISIFQISQKLCQFQKLWREGNTESIMKEVIAVEPVKLTHKKKDNNEEENSSEEMDEVTF